MNFRNDCTMICFRFQHLQLDILMTEHAHRSHYANHLGLHPQLTDNYHHRRN